MDKMNFERQYCEAIKTILEKGTRTKNRTGIDTITYPGMFIRFDDILNNFPMIKGKSVAPRLGFVEMCWFLSGRNDIKFLKDRNLNYWDEWVLEDGTIGKSYGYQFRNFGGVDQVQNLVEGLLSDTLSRRHIVNIWNPQDLKEMSLPPCVLYYQLNVLPIEPTGWEDHDKFYYEVDVTTFARSQDMFLGVPYDFMLAGWFNILICDFMNSWKKNLERKEKLFFIPKGISYFGSNNHIYVNHLDQVKQYLANVEENRNNVIDSKVKFEINDNFEKDSFENIDEYLDYINNRYKELYIINKLQGDDYYGKIEAEVAV